MDRWADWLTAVGRALAGGGVFPGGVLRADGVCPPGTVLGALYEQARAAGLLSEPAPTRVRTPAREPQCHTTCHGMPYGIPIG